MPWYWTDDIARALIESGRLSAEAAGPMVKIPTAIRRDEPSLEEVAQALLDDDEIPIAA